MKTFYIDHYGTRMQNHIYAGLNGFASKDDKEDICAARFCALPVALLDVTIETFKNPLKAIEALIFAIINFLGTLCSDQCSFKDAIYNLQRTLDYALESAVGAALAPLKIFYQTILIAYDPELTQSINYQPDFHTMEVVIMPQSTQEIYDSVNS